jgi:predicted Zn-dependent protease
MSAPSPAPAAPPAGASRAPAPSLIRCCLRGPRALLRRPGRLLAVLILLALIGVGLSVPGMHLWAAYHFRAAEQALGRYRPAEARRHLEQCLHVWPHSTPTHLLAARAARQAGDLDAAARHLDACDETPDQADAVRLEWALLRAQRGEVDAVARRLRSLVEQGDPAAPLILEAMATGYLRMYRLSEADYCAKQWADRQPDNPRAYLLRGWVKEYWNERDWAAADYRKALELDPQDEEAKVRLAFALLYLHHASEALGYLEELVHSRPDNPLLRAELARCRYLLGDVDEAGALLDEVLAARPRLFHALVLRGEMALDSGQPARAVPWLRRALDLRPADYQAHYLLQQALVRCGRLDDARKELEHMRACQADLERFSAILKRKMTRTPHDPALHAEVGRIFLRSGYPAEGLRWLDSALKINPAYPPAHALLAEYYERVGNMGRAQRHRQLAGPTSTRPADAPGP